MNSMHNVLASTLRTIRAKFSEAFLILHDTDLSTETTPKDIWTRFLKSKVQFQRDFDYYLILKLSMSVESLKEIDPETAKHLDFRHEIKLWSSCVFHKLRFLLSRLETLDHVWPAAFPGILSGNYTDCTQNYNRFLIIGLEYDLYKTDALKEPPTNSNGRPEQSSNGSLNHSLVNQSKKEKCLAPEEAGRLLKV